MNKSILTEFEFPKDVVNAVRKKGEELEVAIIFDFKNRVLKLLNTVVASEEGNWAVDFSDVGEKVPDPILEDKNKS